MAGFSEDCIRIWRVKLQLRIGVIWKVHRRGVERACASGPIALHQGPCQSRQSPKSRVLVSDFRRTRLTEARVLRRIWLPPGPSLTAGPHGDAGIGLLQPERPENRILVGDSSVVPHCGIFRPSPRCRYAILVIGYPASDLAGPAGKTIGNGSAMLLHVNRTLF